MEFEGADIEATAKDPIVTGAALIEIERGLEIVGIKAWVAGIDRRAAVQEGVGIGQAAVIL